MKTNTQIKKQLKRKTNQELVKTIIAAKKKENWRKVAEILSGPRNKRKNMNLKEINKEIKDGKKIIIPGKVLSQGELDKKIKIVALSFSKNAEDKILKVKGEFSNILDEIKKNPEMKGLKIIK